MAGWKVPTCSLASDVLSLGSQACLGDADSNEKRTLESGAIAFFQKPADNDELLGVIRASLQAGMGRGGDLPS
jgi:hypothetical protein